MNRRTRTVLVVAIALGTSAIATFAVYTLLASRPAREVEVAHHYIVVAKQALPVGTRLTADDVQLAAWPTSSPIAGAFTAIEQVSGHALTSAVLANEPIVEGRVAAPNAGAGLPPAITQGMRAISVKVDEVVGVAGFVVPGTRVDVLVTVRPNPQQEEMSRVVVSNVTVLTAGTRYDQEEAKNGQPIRSSVVTLMVTPEDAERVALAQSRGHIMLTLRNPLDTTTTASQGVRLASLMGSASSDASGAAPRPAVRAARPAAAPLRVAATVPPVTPPAETKAAEAAAKRYTVDTIRGAKRSNEVVK